MNSVLLSNLEEPDFTSLVEGKVKPNDGVDEPLLQTREMPTGHNPVNETSDLESKKSGQSPVYEKLWLPMAALLLLASACCMFFSEYFMF